MLDTLAADQTAPDAPDGPWDALAAEISAWRAQGRKPRFWWRDDDAVQATPELDRLIELTGGRPLGLAVIPADVEPSLVDALESHDAVEVLLHGWSHTNHEPAGVKNSEFGVSRPPDAVRRDIATGHARLIEMFAARYVPLLVPPWNRIAPEAARVACDAGPVAVSTHLDRKPDAVVPHLNTHADVLDWVAKKQTSKASFIGTRKVVIALRDAFHRRRTGAPGTDPEEAVGLLTHHLQHDDETWCFLEKLTGFLGAENGIDWTSPRAELQREHLA